MLEVRNLSASYGVIPVLHDVSLVVGQGEIVTLLGSNGSGKSTLLNAVQGLLRPTSGSVIFDGQSITGLPSHRIVAMGLVQVPEGHRTFPYMTVKENLLVGAYPGGAWKGRKEAMEYVMELFPILKTRENQEARLLSGGEQQMLTIGRALMSRPRLIMVDEPSIGLAPVVVDSLYQILHRLRESGITILLPEQNALRALELADRGYLLRDGRIVMEDACCNLMQSEMVKKAYLGR
jgi:branched-chain amino acid transport system ATP-binding protein